MAKKISKINVQEEQKGLIDQLKQIEQNLSLLEGQMHDQQVLKWKVVGALEYHDMIFDSDGKIKTADKKEEPL